MFPSRFLLHNRNTDNQKHTNGKATTAKITAMCVLFLASFTIGLLPIKLNQWFNWSSHPTTTSFVKIILGIGGGVLLCTTFVHMLPEISKNFNDLNVTPGIEVSYAELLLCAGFFMMYLIEEFVRTYMLTCKPASNSQEIIEVALKTSISRGIESARTEQQVDISTDSYLITENTTEAIIRGKCFHRGFYCTVAIRTIKNPPTAKLQRPR
uniref:Uncharacterized protein LOC114324825 n=1 Tax=Diabrotica virgifera virgifera TaxID=50390 RepID=A0A6P7EYZ6_DIAVI